MTDSTHHARPAPNRPEYGFLAWQATVGYIASEHSPDALLTITASPRVDVIQWQAALSWGRHAEQVVNQPSLGTALNALWRIVDRHHTVFKTIEAASRKPVHYADNAWLDTDTTAALDRLLHSAVNAFGGDWRLIMVYQPVENPSARVQVRLSARDNAISAGGRGSTLRDACRSLFRNAAHHLNS
jgi:hypothetical protein